MTAPDEPPLSPPTEPIADLLLAQELEACIEAERAVPGSSAALIAAAHPQTEAELSRLMEMVRALEAARESAAPSLVFRAAARRRLLRRIGSEAYPTVDDVPRPIPRLAAVSGVNARISTPWPVRLLAGFALAMLATVAAVGVSAQALPGDALYGFKQAHEEVNLRMATDDDERILALLRRADARLAETERLLELGRTSEAVETAQRFDAVVERATSTYVVTADFGQIDVVRSAELEATLGAHQERLEEMLSAAPETARANLREALAATERGRQLVGEPRSLDRPATRRAARPVSDTDGDPVAGGQAEEQPTVVPTRSPSPGLAAPVVPREPPVIAQVGAPVPGSVSSSRSSQPDATDRGPSAESGTRSPRADRPEDGTADTRSGSRSSDAADRNASSEGATRTQRDTGPEVSESAEARNRSRDNDASEHSDTAAGAPGRSTASESAEPTRRVEPVSPASARPATRLFADDPPDSVEEPDDQASRTAGDLSDDDDAQPSRASLLAQAAQQQTRAPSTVRQGASDDAPPRPTQATQRQTSTQPGPRAVAATAQADSRARQAVTPTPSPIPRRPSAEQPPGSVGRPADTNNRGVGNSGGGGGDQPARTANLGR